MSNMFNQRYALTKLRAELERRKERIYRKYEKFRHLAWRCRNGEEQKKKAVVGNKFKVLGSWVMQCGIREVRRQEVVKEEVKYCYKLHLAITPWILA